MEVLCLIVQWNPQEMKYSILHWSHDLEDARRFLLKHPEAKLFVSPEEMENRNVRKLVSDAILGKLS